MYGAWLANAGNAENRLVGGCLARLMKLIELSKVTNSMRT